MKNALNHILFLMNLPLHNKIMGAIISFFGALFLEATGIAFGLWIVMFVNFFFSWKLNAIKHKKNYIQAFRLDKMLHSGDRFLSYCLLGICIHVIGKYVIDIEEFNVMSGKGTFIELAGLSFCLVEIMRAVRTFYLIYKINLLEPILKLFSKDFKGINTEITKDEEIKDK